MFWTLIFTAFVAYVIFRVIRYRLSPLSKIPGPTIYHPLVCVCLYSILRWSLECFLLNVSSRAPLLIFCAHRQATCKSNGANNTVRFFSAKSLVISRFSFCSALTSACFCSAHTHKHKNRRHYLLSSYAGHARCYDY